MRFRSIKTRFVFGISLGVLTIIGALVGQASLMHRTYSLRDSQQMVTNVLRNCGTEIKASIDAAIDVGQTLAYTLAPVHDPNAPLAITRDQANLILKAVLRDHPEFVAIFTIWEPDAFGQMDVAYVGMPGQGPKGRFMPRWHYVPNNTLELILSTDLNADDPNHFYQMVRQQRNPLVVGPQLHPEHQDVKHVSVLY